MSHRPIFTLVLIALVVLAPPAIANRFDLVVTDTMSVTLCTGCGITLAGLDYGLIVNTGATDITIADLRAARVTATSSTPDIRLWPFINIPNEQLVGAIHPHEAMGSVIAENQLLLPFLRPGEVLRNLAGMQFMAFEIDRMGPYVGPADFHVRMALAEEVAEFIIHAQIAMGPHAISFLTAERVSSGVADREPDCGGAVATPGTLWPPNGELVPIDITGVTDPDGDPVTVTVTQITQDEPAGGAVDSLPRASLGTVAEASVRPVVRGSQCQDAQIIGGRAYLRAERDGSGNGRVYVIQFTAGDGHGGTCDGSVAVCVPHDRGKGPDCVDDGQSFASTGNCAAGTELTALPARPALVSTLVVRNGREIRYSLLSGTDVILELFDVAGRRIATLDQGPRGTGEHTVKWSGTGAPAGVYFVRLRANGQVQSTPVVRIGD